jgi:pimeloyl-ACP methyl ester carboxylesterase
VPANRALLHRFLVKVAGTPAVLVGNSMGGTIAAMQAAAHPETVAGVALVSPAVPWQVRSQINPRSAGIFVAVALSGIARAVPAGHPRTRTPEQMVWDTLRLCCADSTRIPDDVLELHFAAARDRSRSHNTDAELLTAAQSLMWILARRRQFASMLRRIRVPVLLLHGDRDLLVPIGAARAAAAANPSWRFEIAHDVGHVPQLEVPEWTIERIVDWLDSDGAAAAAQARGAGHSPTSQ